MKIIHLISRLVLGAPVSQSSVFPCPPPTRAVPSRLTARGAPWSKPCSTGWGEPSYSKSALVSSGPDDLLALDDLVASIVGRAVWLGRRRTNNI